MCSVASLSLSLFVWRWVFAFLVLLSVQRWSPYHWLAPSFSWSLLFILSLVPIEDCLSSKLFTFVISWPLFFIRFKDFLFIEKLCFDPLTQNGEIRLFLSPSFCCIACDVCFEVVSATIQFIVNFWITETCAAIPWEFSRIRTVARVLDKHSLPWIGRVVE